IPNYLLISSLRLTNTRWAMLLPFAINQFNLILLINFFKTIPSDLEEAAIIDGATAWQSFWRVIFPMLAPAFTFNVVVNLVGAFSAYDVIMATTGGGPGDSTRALNVVLRMQWGLGNFGSGSALGLTVTVLVIIVAIPLVWWLRKREARV
ncbi:MAG TPA: sugar ABC transporter permease, partial [Pseudoclavibacter sp.]|nr:sugar ABC transporter permease [Pseudoclavibacter sp.]